MLDPSAPIPLYRQLAELLRQEISSGRLQPGDKIASEHELVAKFHIGRPTVRQATDLLVRTGLIERRRGSGTYVRRPQRSVDLFSPLGTIRAFDHAGIRVHTNILEAPYFDPMAFPRPGYTFVRQLAGETSPVLIEAFWLDGAAFRDFDRQFVAGHSLSRQVLEIYGLRPSQVHQHFSVVGADEPWSHWLAVPVATPLLRVERELEFSEHGILVRADVYCRTDQFKFTQTSQGSYDE